MNIITSIIGSVFLSISCIIIWNSLQDKKINYKNYYFYIYVIIFSFFLILNYNISNSMIKFFSITFIVFLIIKILYKTDLKLGVLMAIYSQIISIVSELVFSILLVLLFDFRVGVYSNMQVLSANIFVSVFSILIIKTKICKIVFANILSATSKIKFKTLLILALCVVVITNMYLAITYYNYNKLYYIIINILSVCTIMVITYFLAKRENEYIKINNKYNIIMNSLKEYEIMLDQYRISTHENKNQLLTIRNMLTKRDKLVKNYIDKIVQNNLKDCNNVMNKVSKIPSGGLKGLIYSKLLVMQEKNINYILSISKDVSMVDLIKLDDNLVLDICTIIGVYLDNSIEAVETLIEKNISIEMYIQDNDLTIEISNNYDKEINLNKLENEGYTSKGSGHGYGLALTKKIISRNNKISNKKFIYNNIFSQQLKINI